MTKRTLSSTWRELSAIFDPDAHDPKSSISELREDLRKIIWDIYLEGWSDAGQVGPFNDAETAERCFGARYPEDK